MDDGDDLSLGMVGEVGIYLSSPGTVCMQWINRQYTRRRLGRLPCSIPCAPTYQKAKLTLTAKGLWNALKKNNKTVIVQSYSYHSKCVFSQRGSVECCYDKLNGNLIKSPYARAGRSHANHPEEEKAYEDCCFGQFRSFFCPWFINLRPVCTSQFWSNTSSWGKKQFTLQMIKQELRLAV